MAKYLVPILREQFTQFYRFGYTYISTHQLVNFVDIQSSETLELLKEKFLTLSPFEYEEDYLVLELDCESVNKSSAFEHFRLNDIRKIYPLNQRAKNFIASRIDPNIHLEEPIFEDLINRVSDIIYELEVKNAHEKIWEYFDIDGKPEDVFSFTDFKQEYLLKAIDYKRKGIKSFQVKDENYWVYMMLYERYDPFPNGIFGAFYDAGQLFAHSKGSNFIGKGKLYPALETLYRNGKKNELFEVIINKIEINETLEKYRTELTSKDGIRIYRIAPIFQFLKSEIRKGVETGKLQEVISKIPDILKFKFLEIKEYKILVTLLAYSFGYKTFYGSFYMKEHFRFFIQKNNIDMQLNRENDIKSEKNTVNNEKRKKTQRKDRKTIYQYPKKK